MLALQATWGQAIKDISQDFLNGRDFIVTASDAAAELYGYGYTDVLFKPTKAQENSFRPTAAGALSYFVQSSIHYLHLERITFIVEVGKCIVAVRWNRKFFILFSINMFVPCSKFQKIDFLRFLL